MSDLRLLIMIKYLWVLSSLLFLFSSTIYAQDQKIPSLTFAALIVEDIDNSINWYQEVLHFEVINQTSLPERHIKQANLSNEVVHLELIELGSAISGDSLLTFSEGSNRIQGIFKIGFSVDDFDEWVQHFRKLVVQMQDRIVTDPVTGRRMIIIYDPDGNRIQFFEK